MWSYKILNHIPISGKYEEVTFGGCEGSFTRVKFFEDINVWVGVFQNGLKYRIRVHVFDNKSIILSAGIIYVIDLNIKKAISISDNNERFGDGLSVV